ncbi:MAG: hypothetical protein LQ343_004564 [Gyalolechia ehrenbergii]|nr:MAG: hypothetical protein LQ343_004564 [Gyalolechia ehrenbergii]
MLLYHPQLYLQLDREFLTPDLDRLAPHLWLLATQSSSHINPLHEQVLKGCNIVITENPELHLTWTDNRIFIKPIPPYMLSHAFWITHLLPLPSDCTGGVHIEPPSNALVKAVLGYMRTYYYLIRHESDLHIAKRSRLLPPSATDITLEQFYAFIAGFGDIEDNQVSPRYSCYGTLRLSRLNLWAKIFLHRFQFYHINRQYSEYFARFYAPILFYFGILTVVLSAMQVGLQANTDVHQDMHQWVVLQKTSLWFSVATLMCICVIVTAMTLLFAFMLSRELVFATKGIISRKRFMQKVGNLVNKLCKKSAKYQAAGKLPIMRNVYASLTTDVISDYSFPERCNFLSRPGDFDGEHYYAWMTLSRPSHCLKQFHWLFPLLDSMPIWVPKYTSPGIYVFLKQQNYLHEQAKMIHQQHEHVDYKEMNLRPSLIRSFTDSNLLPEDQKHPARIKGEAQISIGAGTLTTSHALKVGTYHILADKHVFDNLMAQLKVVIPDPDSLPTLQESERIPYLMAITYQTLRICYGVSHRLSRFQPRVQGADYPAGHADDMTPLQVHDNEEIFPSSYDFRPGRWLPLNTNGLRLLKSLVPFGGGSRKCVGMELGKAEVLTTIANVFRRFGSRWFCGRR